MEKASYLLLYEPTYRVIICREHQYAVQNLSRHLQDYHGGSIAVRKAVVESFSGFETVEPSQVQLPEPLGRAIDVLGKPLRAFHYSEDECDYISTSRKIIGKHCRIAHDWHSTRAQQECWNQLWVQTFFTAGKQRYFSVLWNEENTMERSDNIGVSERLDIELIKDDWDEVLVKRMKEMEKMEKEVAVQDRTGWFKKTGWPQHLGQSNLKQLTHISRLAERGENDLIRVEKLVETLIERCVAGLETHHPETRRWLRSAKQNDIDGRPFVRLQNVDSQRRYVEYWKRFITYCLRVAKRVTEESSRHTDQEVGRSLYDHVEDIIADTDSGEETGTESEEETSAESEDGGTNTESEEEARIKSRAGLSTNEESDEELTRRRIAGDNLHDAVRLFPWQGSQLLKARTLLKALEFEEKEDDQLEALLQLSASFIFQKTEKDVFESGLVHFLAVLGIDEEMGRLRAANDFSYMLAGLLYDIRLLAIEYLLPSKDREKQGSTEIENFLVKRKEYLADGSYSPTSTALSLLAYGKNLAMNHGNAGMILWSRDKKTMFIRGMAIELGKFAEMAQNMITVAEDILWGEVLWMGKNERFEVALEEIEDDVTFTKRHYSFVSNEKNGLDKGLDWMLERMEKTEQGRKIRKNCSWQNHRVKSYLRTIDRFRELLLFIVHMTGGQPARGPEITGIRFKNGFFQDRNIFVMAGQVATVTRYHKSQSQFDTPKVVPRFLPWRVGQLMVLYIAYVQPFQELLSVKMGDTGWTEHMWSDAQGIWETVRLTKIIGQETATALGVRLTTHLYRHAAAAIGREKVGSKFAQGY